MIILHSIQRDQEMMVYLKSMTILKIKWLFTQGIHRMLQDMTINNTAE